MTSTHISDVTDFIHPPLSVDRLKEAFEALEWSNVEAVLANAGGPHADAQAVAHALKCTNGLIFKYPAPGNEKKRRVLFEKLQAYLVPAGDSEAGRDPVSASIALVELVEAGYRQLLVALSKTDASKLEPAVHVTAALIRAEREIDLVMQALEEHVAGQPAVTPQLYLQDERGKLLDPDAAVQTCVAFAGMTLHMEAFKNKWFDGEIVVIPVERNVSEQAISQAGSTLALATFWRRWQLTEERARFVGQSMEVVPKEDWPADAPPELNQIVRHEGVPELELLHRVAAERMSDKLTQNFFEMMSDGNLERIERESIGKQNLLMPKAIISRGELHAGHAISQMVAYSIFDDQERPGGLRLVEWIRGYAALEKLASEASASSVISKTKAGWTDFFNRHGLISRVAESFIDILTFRRSSRDLFDHPLVRRSDGSYLLFKSAVRATNIAEVTMSTIGQLGEQLQKKGKSFEKAVHNCFAAAGLESYGFKAMRNGAEYEYDVVVPWGEYLFIFECKNRSLPHGNPIQMHYFDMQTESNLHQLQRLMKALDDYPDILSANLPPEALKKKRIGCVLNSLPYCVPGGLDGIYFYDYSALSRFFKNGQVSAKGFRAGETAQVFAGFARLWRGEKPAPEDLLAQLEKPVQFEVVRDTLKLDISGFPLPPGWWAFTSEYERSQHPDMAELQRSLSSLDSSDSVEKPNQAGE